MRGYNRDGRTIFNTMIEQSGLAGGALAQFDFRPAAHAKSAGSPTGILGITPDEAGDGIGLAPGNPTLIVDAAGSTIGTVGTIGDQDFYAVTLVAGQTYEIGMFSHTGGPSLLPLQDSYLEIYNASGQLLGSADGGASTLVNMVNSGFDAVLTFEATQSGTYYINARAFDNDPTVGGSTGEGLGDYELYVNIVDPNDPNVYHPYYEASSPLYAIDWGTQVNRINQTARNPDGDEGTRDTGNAQGTPVLGDPASIAALAAAQGVNIVGKNVITIYFAKAGDVFTSIEDPTSPGLPPILIATGTQQFERDTVWTALHEFEKVADVVYIEVPTRGEADFFFATYAGTPGPGVSLLGSMSPPDYPDEGLAQFNNADYRWNADDLQQGGFSFVTLIHEFGHGHGLAHPHDNGGHSGVMNGVESDGPVASYTTGDFALNQGVFTMMSYEDGWQSSPYGNAPTDVGYGYLGGLMAFDIAAIQDKYGVNEEWATGNDTYTLKDENAPGTYFSSIWDADGNDTIVYDGARAANIDLRAASLHYEQGGGGWMSYAYGIFGGFTIASGVTIENATGGSGDDVLIGNAAANVLTGGGGSDRMEGGAGNDAYYIDAADIVIEAAGGGFDAIFTDASYVLAAGLEIEWLTARTVYGTEAINLTGNELANYVLGNQGANILNGGGGADALVGYGGDDTYILNTASDIVIEVAGAGFDAAYTAASFTLATGVSIEWLAASAVYGTEAMNLTGNEFANTILGNSGANILTGGGGADALVGYGGNDTYYVDDVGDVIVETGGGFDAVYTSASYTLTVSAEVEWLSTEAVYGTAAINLTGNDAGNYVLGNDGANVLDGGAGADVIAGYGGADTFAFTTALGVGNSDSIVDFVAGTDKIGLDDAIFTAIGGLGALNAAAFVIGSGAADGSDRIVYNSATGQLFYDADGLGGAAQIQFATLSAGLALTAGDFTVI